MLKLFSRILLCFVLISYSTVFGQCYNCTSNYPTATPYNTTSNTLTTINTCFYGGDYSYYNVVSGETYTWSTCGDFTFDTYLTLFSGGCGGTVLAASDDDCGWQTTITWTATFTGTVTLLLSEWDCTYYGGCMTIQWACTSCGAVPGCTDPLANNYNPSATIDDGSCTYNLGCTDPLATNYDATAGIDDGSCVYPTSYLHPTSGLLSSYSGACPVATNEGLYFDNGGSASNYSNSINAIYRTFCPSTEGECVRLTFHNFETYNSGDYLYIQNGPAQNSTVMANLWGDLNGSTPFSYQATNSSGCLTVRFSSSSLYNDPGWAATISNVPCTEAQPVNNSDCNTATPICSNTSFSGVANGPGIVTDEGCDACLTGEVYSNWYTFTVQNGGTIGLTISPLASADYDFTLYRGSCGGTMERCSFAPQNGDTGLGNGASDTSEPVTGDSWVSTINVNTGDVFYLMINSWTATGPGFNLTWNLTNGASLDCSVLPVELAEFDVTYDPTEKGANIYWKTESEKNSDYFIVEKSENNKDFEPLFKIEGAGTTSYPTEYIAFDNNVNYGISYYRLKQVDQDGETEYSEVRSINVYDESIDHLTISPNPTNSKVNLFFNSYSKGSAQLLLSDFTGNIIYSEELSIKKFGNNTELDMSEFVDGMYIVQVISPNKTYTGRIIKK